ncbi:MAG: hypothetical protein WCQ96_04955 [Patescibacteria group bacterium]
MDKNLNNSKIAGNLKGNRDVALLCGSLLLSIAFLYFFLSPLYREKLKMKEAYAAKQEDLQSKKDLLKNIEAFNQENKDLAVNSKKLALIISNRNNYEDFLIHLRKLSENYNLELLSFELEGVKDTPTDTVGTTTSTGAVITPDGGSMAAGMAAGGAVAEESPLNQQGIALSLRGNFADFQSFTKSLENGIPFLQEDQVSITSEAKTSSQSGQSEEQSLSQDPILEFKLNLRFIYY